MASGRHAGAMEPTYRAHSQVSTADVGSAGNDRGVIPAFVRRHELALGLLLAVVVGCISIALTMQGWKSRITAFDLLTYVYSADAFIQDGILPRHGDTGSYGSYKPPGTAWLMMPSRLLTADPRLAQYVGTAILHGVTLVAIFLLARRYFGFGTASLAVVLYGISAHGIFLAGSLWPNGRPDVFVLTVLLASQWVAARDARFLAGSLAVWAVGMYVDMAIAPAILIFPALWLYYRPPVRLAPLAVAAAVVLLIWSPYLQLELERGFADVRSQLLLQNIAPADYASTWCDPTREMHELALSSADGASSVEVSSNIPGTLGSAVAVAQSLSAKALSNFNETTLVPLGGVLLGIATAVSVLLFSATGAKQSADLLVHRRRMRGHVAWAGALLILVGAAIHYLPLTADSAGTVMRVGLALAMAGVAMIAIPWLVTLIDRLGLRFGIQFQRPDKAEARRLLVLSLLIPWIFLVAVAEPGKQERFWWIWPLQVIFLSAFLVNWLPRFANRIVAGAALVVTLAIVAANPILVPAVNSWRETSWTGTDAEQVQVVDYVASDIFASGRREAAIGYQTFIYPFMATYHITNPVYKAGADFDILFTYRHGISNTDQCAEGLSDNDDYRIVQTARGPYDSSPRHFFTRDLDGRYQLVGEFQIYQVWKRVA